MSEQYGIWVRTGNWGSLDGGDAVVGTREEMEALARKWAGEVASGPSDVEYEVLPYTDNPPIHGIRLVDLQEEVNARWDRQLGNPCHRSADANHALIHLTKALGKVASAMNDAEHQERALQPEEVAKYLADLVICSARFANGLVNLDQAVINRLAEKFPVGA